MKQDDAERVGKSRERPEYWHDADRNNPSQPVVGTTWFEANAYFAWLSAVTGREYRLPTEVEWEAACRGLLSPAAGEGARPRVRVRVYPWGNEWDASRANTIEGRVLKPSPVGAYGAAGGVGLIGAEDQAGNVFDWTGTIYRPYPYEQDNRESPETEGERVVRDAAGNDSGRDARCANRNWYVPDYFVDNVGIQVFSPGS